MKSLDNFFNTIPNNNQEIIKKQSEQKKKQIDGLKRKHMAHLGGFSFDVKEEGIVISVKFWIYLSLVHYMYSSISILN